MSISTYSELKTAIANWTHRTDLTDRLDDFIDLAESRLSRDITSRQLILRTTSTATTEYHALPADFLSMVSVTVDVSNSKPLLYVPTDQIDQKFPNTPNGIPAVYDVIGEFLRVVPINSEGYTLNISYRAKIPALSDSQTTNYVLTMHPDCYLWASVAEAADYIRDDAMRVKANERYALSLQGVKRANFMAASNPTVRVE